MRVSFDDVDFPILWKDALDIFSTPLKSMELKYDHSFWVPRTERYNRMDPAYGKGIDQLGRIEFEGEYNTFVTAIPKGAARSIKPSVTHVEPYPGGTSNSYVLNAFEQTFDIIWTHSSHDDDAVYKDVVMECYSTVAQD